MAVMHGIVQLAALAGLIVGLYLLAGLAWALFVGCGCVFAASVLVELGRPHPATGDGGSS